MASEADDRSSNLRRGTKKLPDGSFFIGTQICFFRYNRLVSHKIISILITVLLVGSGCGLNVSNESAVTATPDFVTATLPPTRIPPASQTPISTEAVSGVVETPVISSVDGTTTTQLNVRAQPSTASETLGIIAQFATVPVIGKDASGSWYQILYPVSTAGQGWVRAEFVQVNATAEIAVVGGVTGSGSGVSGLVIEKINVRNGPGTDFESLGVLNPKDVIFITGKDPRGEWIQIDHANGVDGKGWVIAKFIQIANMDSIAVIGAPEETTATPAGVVSTPAIIFLPANQDGDSMQSPIASAVFSANGAHALQVNGDVSAPDGDTEDWIQFTPDGKNVIVEAKCSSQALIVELWSGDQLINDVGLACAETLILKTNPGQVYYFRIQANGGNAPQFVHYTIKVSTIE